VRRGSLVLPRVQAHDPNVDVPGGEAPEPGVEGGEDGRHLRLVRWVGIRGCVAAFREIDSCQGPCALAHGVEEAQRGPREIRRRFVELLQHLLPGATTASDGGGPGEQQPCGGVVKLRT
jgi:hypothetical protein